jgi:hypothetical protein
MLKILKLKLKEDSLDKQELQKNGPLVLVKQLQMDELRLEQKLMVHKIAI